MVGGIPVVEQQPHEIVWTLVNVCVAARCIQVIAELGVADHIEDQPVGVGELASSCEVNADALDRVLRLLTAYGVFDREEGRYLHTPASRLLQSDHPMTMRPFARMMGLPLGWGSLTELAHSIRTGLPAIEILEPKGLWAYLQNHPDEAEIFGRAMTAKAGAEVAAVVAAYDFTRFGIIADVGGGRGHLLRAVLDAAPTAEGILFDLPEVINTVDDLDHQRLTAVAGDFFVDALPAADAYVLMEVLHDWADQECSAILNAIRRAAPANSTLLIVEGVIPEERTDPRALTLDIIMLTITGGRERTAAQFSALLDRAGFQLNRVIDTASPMRIVEARPI
jgi:O-methyltransferase